MTLTHENLHAIATSGKGFTNHQLDILGVARPPKKGWVQKLIGTETTDDEYAKLLSLKGIRQKQKQNQNAELPNFESYQLPKAPEKRQQSAPVCVQMAVPIQLVETVNGLIRLLNSLSHS